MSGVTKFVAGVVMRVAGFWMATTGVGWQAATALWKAGTALMLMGAMEEASKLFTPSMPKNRYRTTVEYSGTTTPRKILFGKLRVGGLNVLRPVVTGDGGKALQQVARVSARC